MGCQGQHYLRIPHLIERHRPQLIDAMVGRRQAAALRQQFLSEQKNADKTGHENTPEENEVVDVSASDVSAIDQEGRKHADEYAKLLDSVHDHLLSADSYRLSCRPAVVECSRLRIRYAPRSLYIMLER